MYILVNSQIHSYGKNLKVELLDLGSSFLLLINLYQYNLYSVQKNCKRETIYILY